MAQNTMNLTVELSEDDRALLRSILSALTGAARASVEKVLDATAPTAQAPKNEAEATPAAEAPAPAEPAKPTVTMDQLRKLVADLCANGAEMQKKVKAVVTRYAPRVTGIKPEDIGSAYDELRKLEG